jgi:uncharacterized RDD family membrane protein YckC
LDLNDKSVNDEVDKKNTTNKKSQINNFVDDDKKNIKKNSIINDNSMNYSDLSNIDLKLPKLTQFLGPASVFKRLLAFVVDLLIVNFVIISNFTNSLSKILPESLISDALSGDMSLISTFLNSNPDIYSKFVFICFICIALTIFYFSYMEFKFGQTIGKMLFKLYVIKIPRKTNNARNTIKNVKIGSFDKLKISFFDSFMRSLIFIPVFPFFLLWILDPFFMIINRSNLRLSEKISRTMTVEIMTLNQGFM